MNLPRVTGILKQAGRIDTTWFTDYHRDRGSAVHMACRLLDEGRLDRSTVVPDVAVRLVQYERFLRDLRPEYDAIEESFENPALGYRGTPDRLARIGKRRGVVDIKGVTPMDWHRLQLAAYCRGTDYGYERWALYLADDTYHLKLLPLSTMMRDGLEFQSLVPMEAIR